MSRGRRPAKRFPALVGLLVLGLVLAPPTRAQQTARVGTEAGISRSFPPAGLPDSAATYLEAGADLSLPVGLGQLFGAARGGASLSGQTAGDWLVGTLGGRWMFPLSGGVAAGATITGQAFHVTRPTLYSAVTGRLRPELQWRRGGVTVSLRGQGAVTHTETEVVVEETDGSPAGLPGGAGGTTTTSTISSDLSQIGGGAEIRMNAGPGDLWLRGRSADGELGAYHTAGVGGALPAGPARLSASISYWDTPDGGEVVGGVSVDVRLGGGWSASGQGRRRPPDPLLAIPPSTDLSTTLRREFTFTVGGPRSLYEVGARTADGRRRVVFRLRRPDAESVEVVGGFSDWEPVPMERSDGAWTARLPVTPGLYHFGFRVDGEWVVPERASGVVSDDWGRENATLVVPESGE